MPCLQWHYKQKSLWHCHVQCMCRYHTKTFKRLTTEILAFFRRSIIQRRNYFCPKHDCKINDGKSFILFFQSTNFNDLVEGPKKTCKSCRFNKCVKAGMLIDAVWRRKLLEESDQFCSSSIMQKMLKSRQAAYVNKVNVMSKLSIKLNVSFIE
jgi:hypothetical protein